VTPRRLIEPARLAGTSMLRTQSDARLVDLVRAGHASAFEAIVQRYRKQLLAYCSRLLPASRAEDAVQQTFLKAYQAMISGDADLNLRPWLYRIAHNASLNLLRQNGWSHEQLDENLDGVQRPDQAFELRERLRSTVAAVKDLPERQRNAVLLREIDGLSYEQIASALGVGDGAVRQLLHRARATLRAGMTAVTPVGLVERIAAMLTSGGGDRIAETAAGIGLGTGAVKLGAAMLATGVIATGAVTGPLHHPQHRSTRTTADEASVSSSSAGSGSSSSGPSVVRNTQVDDRGGSGSGSGSNSGSGSHHSGSSHHSGKGGGGGSGSDDHSGSGERHSGSRSGSGESGDDSGGSRGGSGSGSGSGEHSGSGQHRSGSDDGTSHRGDSGSGSGSGSDGSGGGDSHSGSDDGTTTTLSDDQTKQDGGDRHGGSDDSVVTVPTTTTPLPPLVDDSGKDGGGSGGSGSGKGPDGN
jgi:RNA polymerase sigma factor (sigma-70 family)